MTNQSKSLYDLTSFDASDLSAVWQKLANFQHASHGQRKPIELRSDFDHTITMDQMSTWKILHTAMPELGRVTSQAMRERYLALQELGQLTDALTIEWSKNEVGLHVQHGTRIQEAATAIDAVRLRPGTVDLFALCETSGIRTVILSAGVKNIIELVVNRHNIHPTRIIANELYVTDGVISSWDEDGVIHTLNKRARADEALPTNDGFNTIILGDIPDDTNMATGTDNVLRIRVAKSDGNTPAYLQESFTAGYDLVLRNEDVFPLVNLVKQLVQNTSTS